MDGKVKMNGEWIEIKDLPVRAILPCRKSCGDCKHLKSTDYKEYMRCTYQPPKVPRAYWQYDVPYKEPAQWRNTKYLEGNGPFTADAERVECEVFEI